MFQNRPEVRASSKARRRVSAGGGRGDSRFQHELEKAANLPYRKNKGPEIGIRRQTASSRDRGLGRVRGGGEVDEEEVGGEIRGGGARPPFGPESHWDSKARFSPEWR